MFEYFYNEILRRTIISFGTLFNNITIKQDGSVVKVPLAYGPTQKFLARIEQSPDLNKPFAITLPRMSFEFTGLTYDSSRKVTTTQQFSVKDPDSDTLSKKAYMPVPYNMEFELAIMCKLNDDALQITEQILPYFQPSYNLTVNLVSALNEKRDIPVILENVTMQDDYEGDYESRRVLLYTLRFTAKTYLFGPTSDASGDIIKKSTINYLTGTDTTNTRRELTYSVTPKALKDYTDDIVTLVSADILAADKTIDVEDASDIAARKYIDIDGERIYVRSKSGNTLNVTRGKDGAVPIDHVIGAQVKGIDFTTTSTSVGTMGVDSAVIPEGDDFGFDGTITDTTS